jgi:hypothetical protein
MPCRPARARKLVEQGKATAKWRKGFYYIQMTVETEMHTQTTVVDVDPGSKREAFTVKAEHATFLNLQSHARDGKQIKKDVETRANARRARRGRNTPCRAPRYLNRSKKGCPPPSTKARWQLKLNIIKHLCYLYPISVVVIEDVKAVMKKGNKHWNNSFSPIQAGKNWMYTQLESINLKVIKKTGMDTFHLRQAAGLDKTKNKLADVFIAHCVDSWVLANEYVGGHVQPDSIHMLLLKPLSYSRRQLHHFNPSEGSTRSRYGGTMSLGYKKGTLVRHPTHGKCLIGGNWNGKASLHATSTMLRLCRNYSPNEMESISYSPWVVSGLHHNRLPVLKRSGTAARQNAAKLRLKL